MSSCEGDIHQTLRLMVLHFLSDKPDIFLYVVGAFEENNSLQFMSCVFASTTIARNSIGVKLHPQVKVKGNGITQSFSLHAEERVTLYRIYGRYPLGSYTGRIISDTPSKSRLIVNEWPSVEVVLDKEKGWAHF
jgi:L-fucose isomerase-like protein